jgi:hypothetical protein
MTSHEYLQLSNKLEDCIPLLAKCGAATDKELLREMFLKYYKKYATVKSNEQESERN